MRTIPLIPDPCRFSHQRRWRCKDGYWRVERVGRGYFLASYNIVNRSWNHLGFSTITELREWSRNQGYNFIFKRK